MPRLLNHVSMRKPYGPRVCHRPGSTARRTVVPVARLQGVLFISSLIGAFVELSSPAFAQCDPTLQVCFQGIGDLPDGTTYSDARGVAHNGAYVVVVGFSYSSTSTEAVKYLKGLTGESLGHVFFGRILSGNAPSHAADVALVTSGSQLKTFVTGSATIEGGQRAMRAIQTVNPDVPDIAVAPELIPSPSGINGSATGTSISDDGLVIVGTVSGVPTAFKWTEGDFSYVVPPLQAGFPGNAASGVSPDGRFTVGYINSSSGFQGFILPKPGTLCPLPPMVCNAFGIGDFTGGLFYSQANAVTNGGLAVGYGYTASGREAFRRTPDRLAPLPTPGQMISLGDFPGGSVESNALSVSGDGQIVVGYGTTASGRRAFFWDPVFSLRELSKVLEESDADLSGWTLTAANAISTNGLAIAGSGTDPSGNSQGWFVTLPDCNSATKPGWDGLEAPAPFTRVTRSVLSFDGANDYAEVGQPSPELRITGSMTIEAWIYLHRTSAGSVITFGEGSQDPTDVLYGVGISDGNVRAFHLASGAQGPEMYEQTAITNLQTGRWYHIAVVRGINGTGANYSLYLDNDSNPIVMGSMGLPLSSSGGRLRIGEGIDPPNEAFDGHIADVRIWNVERNAAQIHGSMFKSTLADTTGLVASWRMDEPTGNTMLDSVGTNHLAIVQGGARLMVGADCNQNRIPDTCEVECNGNGIPDDCDIRDGDSHDCNVNGKPDECEDFLELLGPAQSAARVFREGRGDPVNPTTFGTTIQAYGRPWKKGTNQTPGGGVCVGGAEDTLACSGPQDCVGGACETPDGSARDPAEELRMFIRNPACRVANAAVAQGIYEHFFGFEMLLGNEAFADAMDSTIGGPIDDLILREHAFQGLGDIGSGVGSLLEEELALLRGRQIFVWDSADQPLSDTDTPDGNYPQFESVSAAVYNRLRPNADNALFVAYPYAYNVNDDEEGASMFPQGHGDAYGYYLGALKVYLEAFGAGLKGVCSGGANDGGPCQLPTDCADGTCNQDIAFAAQMIQSQLGTDSEEIVDDGDPDQGIAPQPHQVGFQSLRNMAAAMGARARTVNRIVDLTYRRDFHEPDDDIDTPDTHLTDDDQELAWGMADWARRGGLGAYLDWAVLNHLLPLPEKGSPDAIEAVHRRRIDEIPLLAAAVEEMQERVDAAGSGLNPLGLMPNVVPFRIIQPGSLENFLEDGANGKSHYGQVREQAANAIENARRILSRANVSGNRLRENETDFCEFEKQVQQSDRGLTDRLIEIFGYPSPDDESDNDFDSITDDAFEAANSPDLRNFLADAQVLTDLGLADRAAVGQIQLAMFELRSAALRVENARLALSVLGLDIAAWQEEVELDGGDAEAEQTIIGDACDDQEKVIDRKEELAKAKEAGGFFHWVNDKIGGVLYCFPGLNPGGCEEFLDNQPQIAALLNRDVPSKAELLESEFDLAREENRINCWQTASLAGVRNREEIRQSEMELERLMRRTPQAIVDILIAENQASQALAVVRKNVQEGRRLLAERDRMRRVQSDKLQNFRWRDMAYRNFRNQALEQYGAFFELAARYVMLAARAFAYEYNDRDVADGQVERLYRERLLGTESPSDSGLQGVIDTLDSWRGDFNGRLQKLSLFEPPPPIVPGDLFSIRKNLLGLHIVAGQDTPQQQREKNKAFRAFLESHIVQDLLDVPAFRQFGSIDTRRDSGPALVLTFSTEVGAGGNFFGKSRTAFGPENFSCESNPKLFEFAILLEGVDNPVSLTGSVLVDAHFLPVGASMLREPVLGNCATRPVRSWAVVDQLIPSVTLTYSGAGNAIDPNLDIPGAVTSPGLGLINPFPATQAQIQSTDSPVFQDELAGWSVWNTQWVLAIPGRQWVNPTDDISLVRRKLLILIYGADAKGNPRNPDDNLGIDDIKLRIKAYGKP